MKSLLLSLALCFIPFLAVADDVPAFNALQAATVAQADLESRGLQASVYIAEIVYRKAALLGEAEHWEVLWSKEFDAQTEGRKEIGLKVKMDGTYTRSVR